MMLDRDGIQEIIPHRDPFLFIDQIDDLVIGKKARGTKFISPSLPMFEGHFPNEAVMPGVLIVEALAQVGAVALLSDPVMKGKIAYFGAIKNAKFRRKVVPGDVLELETELTKRKGPFGFGVAKAKVNGELACECEIMFTVG